VAELASRDDRGLGRVAFGIAGWSYADWRGVVYPPGCRDALRYCARFVDCIEINSTFYRLPEPALSESWARRTADLPLWFTAKVPQLFTHDLRLDAGALDATRSGLAPLADAGKLRLLLAQFSHHFVDTPRHRLHLTQLAAELAAVAPLAVEVRHRSWCRDAARAFLVGLDVSVVHLDYPGARSGAGVWPSPIRGPAGVSYLRLHGRNTGAWFRKDAVRDEVYDYLYQPDEVQQLITHIGELAAGSSQTVVIGNNHFQGQAMKVVLELMAAWHHQRVDVPPGLLARHAELKAIAKRDPPGLFG
jgi:uncharacterized protein YecE (DUF72 family)